eukprot:1137527-Pelagomonas_calceolata.AAC.2
MTTPLLLWNRQHLQGSSAEKAVKGVAGGEVAHGKGRKVQAHRRMANNPPDPHWFSILALSRPVSLVGEALASLLVRGPFLTARSQTWRVVFSFFFCPLAFCVKSSKTPLKCMTIPAEANSEFLYAQPPYQRTKSVAI